MPGWDVVWIVANKKDVPVRAVSVPHDLFVEGPHAKLTEIYQTQPHLKTGPSFGQPRAVPLILGPKGLVDQKEVI